MKLTSIFSDNQEIPQKYGKMYNNISLPFSWSDAPADTKSFALTIVDKHPVARNYVHWMVVDIPASTESIKEGAAPEGCRVLKPYAGPFPPSGTHEYEVTLYALKAEQLVLPTKPTLDQFISAVSQQTLATATLKGTFTKN